MASLLEFNYLEFLKEEIWNDTAAVRIGAASRVHLIASALGPEKSTTELVPVLAQVIKEEPLCNDAEFMYSMAKQFLVLSEYIDGRDELLIGPLEHLAAQDETLVREQAIQSLCEIVTKRPALAPEYLLPALHRLATTTDFFTARISACALLPTAYRFAGERQKAGLREVYSSLCADDVPMVRRAAAHRMHDLVSVCDKEDILGSLIGLYKQHSREDTQDTIRVSSVHTTLVISKMLSEDENKQHTISVVKDAAEDRSWRVRLTAAKNFDGLCAGFGPQIVSTHLLPLLVQLMKDSEQQVRTEAVQVVEPCLGLPHALTADQLQQHVLPQLLSMGSDPALPVRAALAQVLGPLAKVLGREGTERQLLGLVSELTGDEFYDVRIGVVSSVGLLCDILGDGAPARSLLSTVQGLILDDRWRIRQKVVEQVPKLARLFGVSVFESALEAMYLSGLHDPVHAVREVASQNLKEITSTFGSRWAVEHLLPKLVEQYSQGAGYVNRVTSLHALQQLSGVMSPEQVMQFVIPVLVKATKDGVPNVRICACLNIMWLVENCDLGSAAISTVIKPTLVELEHDSDIDVQYYSQRAIAACGR